MSDAPAGYDPYMEAKLAIQAARGLYLEAKEAGDRDIPESFAKFVAETNHQFDKLSDMGLVDTPTDEVTDE